MKRRTDKTGAKPWSVDCRDHTGKRHVKAFYDQQEAEEYAKTLRKEVETDGPRALALPYEVRRDASTSVVLLEPYGCSLIEAVQFYVRYKQQNEKSCTVQDLIEMFLLDKENEGVSQAHLRTSRLQFDRFARHFGKRTVSTLTFDEIKEWLQGMNVKPITRIGYRRGLKSLFNYACRRKFALANPIDEIHLPKPKEEPIEIFTVDKMRALLQAADPQTLPFLAIGGLAGLRSAEIFRLDWRDARWQQGVIEVSAAIAKTGARRFVPISENLRAWLHPISKLSGPLISQAHQKTFYRQVMAVARKVGILWKHNALRHSYASYRTAIVQDVGKVSREMGNSPRVIFKHYRKVVYVQDAEAFWNIYPFGYAPAVPLQEAA